METAARSKNFSSNEICTLLSLVQQNSSILECKATGKVRPDQKDKVWETITESFNSVCSGAPRSTKNLRTKYLNLKADMKKRSADHKKYVYGTGGGPCKEPDPADTEVDTLMKYCQKNKCMGWTPHMTTTEDQMMEEEIDIKAKWTEKKLKEEIEFTKIEHTLRVQQMKEAHELQQKFIIEKHVLEMRILEDQLKPK
ncbi:myb/SANT-like DNA-binding domain-containing protein 3 [Zeugodacus cucurbitae]|uniref:myb/SANT-like DNA-binding domain-containing protein 3 n=1 Tax=Zeugodacus cucurbitae TaxID=28588 RepID=UPI0023D8EA62|nr:myb/SANT-like DNA-binding domain-containing protein 3 [Zeugodacus cucurbitae]